MSTPDVSPTRSRWKGPLAGKYWAAVALVVCALMPYLVLSSALSPLLAMISASTHLSTQALALGIGMANAGYALGTVLSVQLAQLLPPRRMLVAYSALFVTGSVLAAWAPTPGLFIAGHIMQGLGTSLMLIAAVPPLASTFPVSRLPTTAVVLGLGIFGAVAAGPVVGGLQAADHAWRPLFWIVVGIGAVALVMTVLVFQDEPPEAPGIKPNTAAVVLAGVGSGAVFFGASELASHSFGSPIVLGPFFGGVLALVGMLVHEYVIPEPLVPVRALWTTIPVAATIAAMAAGAASVGLAELAQTALSTRYPPWHVGVLFLPELAGALVTSFALGALLRTRWYPVLTICGMAVLTCASAMLMSAATASDTWVLTATGLLGLGAGSTVSPALLFAGFARPPTEMPNVYAVLELLRGVAAFALAPIVLRVATTTGSETTTGVQDGLWICLGIAAAGGALAALIWFTGRPPWCAPDITNWKAHLEPALDSPPLGGLTLSATPLEGRS